MHIHSSKYQSSISIRSWDSAIIWIWLPGFLPRNQILIFFLTSVLCSGTQNVIVIWKSSFEQPFLALWFVPGTGWVQITWGIVKGISVDSPFTRKEMHNFVQIWSVDLFKVQDGVPGRNLVKSQSICSNCLKNRVLIFCDIAFSVTLAGDTWGKFLGTILTSLHLWLPAKSCPW